ncbi:MAG: hypothetical protein DSY42_02065 [Aquifex sp.]|nr:MAG: hypothetical protein DSY42_02065 [Aquifex sp.]
MANWYNNNVRNVKAKLYKAVCGNLYHLPNLDNPYKSLCGCDIFTHEFKIGYVECSRCLRVANQIRKEYLKFTRRWNKLRYRIMSYDD